MARTEAPSPSRGVAGEVGAIEAADAVTVVHAKVTHGTADLRSTPAMDAAALDAALRAGREAVASEERLRRTRCVAVGEVGIGSTTSAAALPSRLAGCASRAMWVCW